MVRASRNEAVLLENGKVLVSTPTIEELAEYFQARVMTQIAFRGRGGLFLHAAVVGIGGGAVVLPGRSGAGKTTLAAAAVAAGADYLTDEYCFLDDDGMVSPCPRPLRSDSGAVRAEVTASTSRLPARSVVLTHFERSALAELRRLDPAHLTLGLIPHTLSMVHNATRSMERLARLSETVAGYAGARGEAEEFARSLVQDAARFTSPG